MALPQLSASLSISSHGICLSSAKLHVISGLSKSRIPRYRSAFSTGSPLRIRGTSYVRNPASKVMSVRIRSEQSTKDGSCVDVWLGRLAMIGFAAAISVEIATGKGLLENFGVTAPLPTVALAVIALVGVLTSIFIFQSASKS